MALAGPGVRDVRYIPGQGYVDISVLPKNPKPEDGERFVLTADIMHGGYTYGVSLDRGFIYGAGELPTVHATQGPIALALRGRVVRYDATMGRLMDTPVTLRADHEIEILKPDNTRHKLSLAKIAMDYGGLKASTYIDDWPHPPTEVELFERMEAVRKAVEEKCAWLPFRVQVADISPRFIFYWSHSGPEEQRWYLTLAPRGKCPFNDEWLMSSRFLDEYPPDRVEKGEKPPGEWKREAPSGIMPLLYRGGAFLLRPLLDGQDFFSGCRIFVREDTSFIVSDQCQRADALSRDGTNMQYATQWAIDTWLLTYAARKIPSIAVKSAVKTFNLGSLIRNDDSNQGPVRRQAAYLALQVEKGGGPICYPNGLDLAKKREATYDAGTRSVRFKDGDEHYFVLHYNLAMYGSLSGRDDRDGAYTKRIYVYAEKWRKSHDAEWHASNLSAYGYFAPGVMPTWAPMVGALYEMAGDTELLFALLEATDYHGSSITREQLNKEFERLVKEVEQGRMVAEVRPAEGAVPPVATVVEDAPAKPRGRRARTKKEEEAAPEAPTPF